MLPARENPESSAVTPQSTISHTCRPSASGSNGLAMTPRTPSSLKRRRSAACTFAVRKITGMSLVAGSRCNAANVAGPSMSGIITSRRMASGRAARAVVMPDAPDSAVSTSQSSVSSSVASAISRISSSSSMISTRLRCTFNLHFRRDEMQEAHDLVFELLERHTALGQKLRGAEAQPLLIRGLHLLGGVNDQRDVREGVGFLQPVDDVESVHLRQDEIEHDQIGTPIEDQIDRRAPRRRMHGLQAVRLE